MSRPAFWFLLVVGLAGLLLARESRQPLGSLAGVDRAFLDWLAANAKPAGAAARAVSETPPVTLVEIDDTVLETPRRWPLTALDYASFLESVQKYDPAVVAIAPVLDLPPSAPGSEQILLDQALTVSRLLLAVELGVDAPAGRDPAGVAEFPAVGTVSGPVGALPEFTELASAPSARLGILSAAAGAVNLPGGNDAGPVRDVPLLFRWRGRVVPTFTLQALTLALRLAPREVSAVPGSHIQFGDRLRLPIDRAGRALLDARALRRVNRLGFDDLPLLAAGQAGPETRAAAERMRGGVVVLGRTDRAVRTRRTPDGQALSPAETFAWAVASLEREPPLRRASAWWDATVLAGFAAVGWFGARLRKAASVALAAGSLAAYLLVALTCFETSRLWLPVALPLGLTLVNVLLPFLLPGRAVPFTIPASSQM